MATRKEARVASTSLAPAQIARGVALRLRRAVKERQACAVEAEKGFFGFHVHSRVATTSAILCKRIDFGAGSSLRSQPAKGSML